MEGWKEKLIKICLVIVNLILVLKLVIECFKIEEFNYIFVGLLIILGIIIYMFSSLVLNSIKKRVVFLISLCVIVGFIIYKTSGVLVTQEAEIISLNLKNINKAAIDFQNINFEEFIHIFSLTIPIITALLIVITQKFNIGPLLFTSGIFITFWYQIFYKAVLGNIPYLITLIILTLGINEYIKRSKEYKGREIKTSIKVTQIILVVVILAIIVPQIILVFPQDYKGKSIDGMKRYFENEFAEDEGGGRNPVADAIEGSYGLKKSGYSDSSNKLGGRISINSNEVFTVDSDMTYYLRGRVSDNYTGKAWLKYNETLFSSGEKYRGNSMKKLEQVIEREKLDIEEKSLTVYPNKKFKTTSFFTPNGGKNIDNINEGIFLDKVPIFMSNELVVDSYEVDYLSYGEYDKYLQGIENSEYMKVLNGDEYTLPIREFGEGDDEYISRILSLVENYIGEESINIISSKFSMFRQDYLDYIKINAPINDEVYKIVNDILGVEAEVNGVKVEELTNHQKSLAIRSYLMDNYEYVTNVKSDNQYNDFVSDFLLVEKEGYCTYFATATVMMCRIAGVPARYVEGFKMSDMKNDNGTYRVTNEDAHAWAEILINPYSDHWAVVDSAPTPREYEEALTKEKVDTEESTDTDISNELDSNMLDKNTSGYEDEDLGSKEMKMSKKLFSFYMFILALAISVIYFISIFWINRIRVLKSKSIIPLYNYYVERLKTINIIKGSSEGDLEFVAAIHCKELKGWMSAIVNQSYDEFYGGIVVQSIDKKQYLKYIEKYIKNKEKWYKYIVKKYFMLR